MEQQELEEVCRAAIADRKQLEKRITDLETIIAAARSELQMKDDDSRTLAEACHDQRQATKVAVDEGKQRILEEGGAYD